MKTEVNGEQLSLAFAAYGVQRHNEAARRLVRYLREQFSVEWAANLRGADGEAVGCVVITLGGAGMRFIALQWRQV